MAASAVQTSTAAMRQQLLAQIQTYQTDQARVNNGIGQLTQMDTAAFTPLMVAKVTRQLANESARLAQLADDIDSTIALTTHTHTLARRLQVSDIPAEPISIVLALSDFTAVARLKATARHFRNALRPIIRRTRLRRAIERAGVGGVVQFDDQLSHGDVMKATWVVEEGGEGGWGEVEIQLDSPSSAAIDYSSVPRFCAQWMIVGRRVALRRPNGQQDGTLQLFHHNNELSLIRNQPGFTVTINPPLPLPSRPIHPFSRHPFQQHAKPHDPPVRCRIGWRPGVGWMTGGVNGGASVTASASSLLKNLVLSHRMRAIGGMYRSPMVAVDRAVHGGYLDRIVTQSPHTPLHECSHVMTYEMVGVGCGQSHVLTSSDDPFIAYIALGVPQGLNDQNVPIAIVTTEAPAAGVANDAPFAQRYPLTAAMARPVLGPIAPIVLDGQAP
ncbi:unnamed protein product [Vitrella brassicaformis CCMP3155]|uniref:Uncharacterized protein n=1 Tax=Vitrella brassicaformis (strain CCMP3155) TaxID=1169540 RepID=A0A0G4GSG0_VITBC|nr:unnamed protein product [Vitrella brassicaformis CCMP3155]|eukprot:CEM33548.1 unnamed protein product [Vitrella brassicaformis CCMP3155]